MSNILSSDYLMGLLLSVPGVILAFSSKGFAQAFTADKLGDPTPRNCGRLTMNPKAHIDIIGFLFILVFHFGWTKPVPVNTRNFNNIKRDNCIFILSGPVGCILAGALAGITGTAVLKIMITFFGDAKDVAYYAYLIFMYAQGMCISLAAFYLLPLPGLDGYKFIANLLPYKYYEYLYKIEKYSNVIFMVFILLIYFTSLSNYIFWPANQFNSILTNLWFSLFRITA